MFVGLDCKDSGVSGCMILWRRSGLVLEDRLIAV